MPDEQKLIGDSRVLAIKEVSGVDAVLEAATMGKVVYFATQEGGVAMTRLPEPNETQMRTYFWRRTKEIEKYVSPVSMLGPGLDKLVAKYGSSGLKSVLVLTVRGGFTEREVIIYDLIDLCHQLRQTEAKN